MSEENLQKDSLLRTIIQKDLLASVVVFLVALPLCMGIAIASGAPASAGLITGIVGGLVVGFFAGAPLQVSGPAAGLSVIVWDLIQTHGYGALGWIVLVAGGVQFLAGQFGFGRWFRAVSPAVIHGMLAGIGILIFASQFHVMVDDAPRGSGLANLLAIPEAIIKGYTPSENSPHFHAAMLGLFTLALLISWKVFAPGKLKLLPPPLAAVVGATLAASFLDLNLIQVDVPASMLEAIRIPPVESLTRLGWGVLLSGFAMAFIASAETLLCASAVDKMHTGPRAKFDKELKAQGLGNMICGVLGALPMTGVIVRSSANIEAGGKTRASAILHGGWLLLFCAGIPFVLREIPTSALAAVLVFTGYRLCNIAALENIAKLGRLEVGIYAATVIGIVGVDLLTGVVAGIVLSLARILYDVANLKVDIKPAPDGTCQDVWLSGSATVISLPKLEETLEEIPKDVKLNVHLTSLDYIDHACLDYLTDWQKQRQEQGAELTIDHDALKSRFGTRRIGDEESTFVKAA